MFTVSSVLKSSLLPCFHLLSRQCFQRVTWTAIGHRVDPLQCNSCLKPYDPKPQEDLIFQDVFNEDGGSLTASEHFSFLKWTHFTKTVIIQKHFSMVSLQKDRLPSPSSWEMRCIKFSAYIQKAQSKFIFYIGPGGYSFAGIFQEENVITYKSYSLKIYF